MIKPISMSKGDIENFLREKYGMNYNEVNEFINDFVEHEEKISLDNLTVDDFEGYLKVRAYDLRKNKFGWHG